ncbi:nucleoside-diphosphate sugar epimerase [Pedobacter sp. NJ-S-72]
MVFNYITGTSTDSTEQSKTMWARVKGKTENDLMKLPFKGQYNFRPGGMAPVKGQKNTKMIYVVIVSIIKVFSPKSIITLNELGQAMINSVLNGYPKQVLEISDIKILAKE